MLALGLVSCKKGSISGQVLDPFTGKPVANSTIWVENTPYLSKSVDGSFKFEKVKPGSYRIFAGKNKFSKTSDTLTLTEEALNGSVNLYIYSLEVVDPGLYLEVSEGSTEKIQNLWLNWELSCKDGGFAYRQKFTDTKTKKDIILPAGQPIKAPFKALFNLSSSAVEKVSAKLFPVTQGRVSNHSDCQGFNSKKEPTGLFPDLTKGIELQTTQKSNNLYEISGEFPAGKQAMALYQGGKFLKSYLFEVK